MEWLSIEPVTSALLVEPHTYYITMHTVSSGYKAALTAEYFNYNHFMAP